MNPMRGIDLKGIAEKMNGASGAEVKAICTEVGMFALRERRVHVTQEDFEMAIAKVFWVKDGIMFSSKYTKSHIASSDYEGELKAVESVMPTGDDQNSKFRIIGIEMLLQNNNIFGPIPIELGTVPLLQTLDLSNNRFSGPIPTSFAQLNGLHYLLNKYLDVVFLKLDCNQDNKTLAKELGIKVVSTFKILKDKKVVKELTGAKFDDLVHAIDTIRSN
ncbi:thioredoxin F-type [Cucumis melo var. makuwa]|uniref:Thioredoxin F-type n=1 Tax=Cucumis melo var. makuwa TaxID=1194695 RepID=A0A5A7UBM5_CUCMM|nr:thioredoxin F-type [Cucumis melo var. makuwa]TYK30543.1 thioredoxin F-type [Cucumis melo var. makuwa]